MKILFWKGKSLNRTTSSKDKIAIGKEKKKKEKDKKQNIWS